ncbi:MAG: glutathione-disulfide reductase [Myxococcales bacterium]|nr:glutathione-disulfide reductase [Myxococcales bacterium]
MTSFDYDLLVIGAGSGGVRAARIAAGYGAKVAIVEYRELGGTCVNLGCIPKKIFSYAANFRYEFEGAKGFGWASEVPAFAWPTLRENKNAEIARLNGIYERLLSGAGVEIVQGRAQLIGPHAVEVDGKSFSAERILIAVGGRPNRPDQPGFDLAITSDQAFHLETLPKRAVVVGGGYIAVEFAGIFAALGVDTTLVHRGARVLRGFDEDIRTHLTESLEHQGVKLHLNRTVDRIERNGHTLRADTSTGESVEGELILLAVGRVPNTDTLGVDRAGVELDDRGAIKVDEYFRTTCDSVYALGDVINRVTLTPVAIHEAMAFVRTQFADTSQVVDYDVIPSAVFSHPPIGTVGLSELQAVDKYDKIDVYESAFRPLKHTISGLEHRSYMKLIVHRSTDRVVGMHMIGDDAPEIMQGFAAAIKAGVTKAVLDSTIGIHPTAAEEFVTMRIPRASDS